MIKKLIIGLIVAVILAGSAVAVVYHYTNTTKIKRQNETAALQSQIDAAQKELKSLQAAVTTKVTNLTLECQKGVKAYEALPAATKAKVEAPICDIK